MRRNRDLLPVQRNLEGGFSPWSESSLFSPSTLFAESPWQMMRRMQADMDQLFSRLVQPVAQEFQRVEQSWAPHVDISHDDKEWLIEAELPGVDKDNINVEVRNGQLMIRAEMRQEQEHRPLAESKQGNGNGDGQGGTQEGGQQRQYHRRERRYGFFERALPLPENVDEEQIHCEFKDGLLKVHLPMTQEQKPRERRIPIAGEAQQPATRSRTEDTHRAEHQAGEPKREMASAGAKGGQRSGGSRRGANKS